MYSDMRNKCPLSTTERQPRATSLVYIVSGVTWIALTSYLKGVFIMHCLTSFKRDMSLYMCIFIVYIILSRQIILLFLEALILDNIIS